MNSALGAILLASGVTVAEAPDVAQGTGDKRRGDICIALDRLARYDIRSPFRVDFRLRDGRVFRNDLPRYCRDLDVAMSFDFPRNKVCSGDEVYVPNRAWSPGELSHFRCRLGTFVALAGKQRARP